ncbi:MAG TPA: prolyl oligopeptidase family serine peptidase [Phenylobacterium sp.]|nr:prolyl oligopeptidase family serine peptidase [Phenylobacterium sp.]
MTRPLLALLAFLALAGGAGAQQPDDPFLWLEEVDGAQARAWVEAETAAGAGRLEGDPRFADYRLQALAILTATDRIPMPSFRAGGVDNLWQDKANPRGVWRHASLASYESDTPAWRTLIDLDALSRAEGRNWIWKGSICLEPAETRCLVRLSDGGGDAVELREFDAAAGRFVEGGFRLPMGKQNVAWLDADHLLVAREWAPGEVTASGYPYILKSWTRGEPLAAAREIYRGEPGDVQVLPMAAVGDDGAVNAVLAQRWITFSDTEFTILDEGRRIPVPLPRKAASYGYAADRLIFRLKTPWRELPMGALVAYDPAALRRAPQAGPELIFAPDATQAVQAVHTGEHGVIVELLENVKGAIDSWRRTDRGWTRVRLDLPKDGVLRVVDAADDSDAVFVNAAGFLSPTALWRGSAESGKARAVKSLPAKFDAGGKVVEQFWATSTDGTKIPYFLVRPADAPMDGSAPTIMFAYGGFESAMLPNYLPEMGKLWLEKGGAYVIANIRGGGEFGPAWHHAALREHRQRSFDDFAAVARDLHARGITSPRRLGIYGRSNGGVLTSVSIVQRPELWNAAVIESPLIDMLRYHKLPAGASWIAEYGDPEVAADAAFIGKYSAYQALKPGMQLPEPYITTNTKDDRVHPGHARKFAAKMKALGYPYIYYEQTFGGHSNDADPELNAGRWARHYVYLTQKLMD